MPPASTVSGASAGVASDAAVQERLLHHANEIRKHGNLDPLDAFLTHSGYSWIEMMVSHARDSHESYVTSTHDVDSTMAHAFEHRMAAELLKTPSPKKKRVKSALPQMSADPFADDDKENAVTLSPLKAKAIELKPSAVVAVQGKTANTATRSKSDKSQLIQLPNPFEKRVLQAGNGNAKKEDTLRKASSSKTARVASLVDLVAPPTASTASPLRHDFDDDSREVECSLLAVSDVPRPHVKAKEVGKISTLGLDATRPIIEDVEDATPSPRESTPPPMSPTKNERAEASMWARQKLDESLLRIESDEEGEEAQAVIVETPAANDGVEMPEEQATTVNVDVASEEAKEPERLSIENSTANLISAPKRTLSSMAHAKKSLAGNNGKQQARSSSLAPSSSGVAKGSFLSKSIMRAELDQTTADDTLDTLPSDGEKDVLPTASAAAENKRKSEEEQSARLAKSHKAEASSEEASKRIGGQAGNTTVDDKSRGATQPQQTLKEKIESYAAQKPPTNATPATPASSSASSGLSSMTAHQVGVGAAKIASPIFSRSNSSNTLHAESAVPSDTKRPAQNGTSTDEKEVTRKKMQESESGDLGKTSSKAQTLPISTTPLNSPGPSAYSLYPKIVTGKKVAPQSVLTAQDLRQIKAADGQKRTSHISIDDASESDLAAYDTSSDGDLSLVDLMVAAPTSQTSVPRPPGATTRVMPAPPKAKPVEKIERPPSSMAVAKATTSSTFSAIKDVNRSPARLGTASSTTSTSSGSSGASSANHATWGGSISSKLKGILGFSSSTSGASPTRPAAASKATNGAIKQGATQMPARKDSFVANGNSGARTATLGASTSAKASSIIRQKEAEAKARQIEERARLQAQSNAEAAKKRARDEALTTAVKAGVVSGVNKQHAAKSVLQKQQAAQHGVAAEVSKKRKSNEGVALVVPQQKTAPTASNTSKIAASAAGSSSAKVASNNTVKSGAQTLPKTFAKASEKPAAANSVFSDHNPFQKAQQQQQQQALAAVAQQMQRHHASTAVTQSKTSNLSPNSKLKMAATEHIELEEPDSAYSDSEDEETIRRRMQHKPWETREGLAEALEAQSTIDADAIFGIPQGGVPLDDILPPQTENARVRRMRPRSSSATWSRDGLKQFEIDRYNERMGIKGPGVQLMEVPAVREDPARSPGRAGRMSALAQSAIAQGHVSSSLHKKTSQAFR
jgi:hypothetical protein